MGLSKLQVFLVLMFIATICYEFYLNLFAVGDKGELGAPTQITLSLIPVCGALYGLYNARKWGGLKTVLGKTLTFLSLGTLSWGLGVGIWLIYIYVLGIVDVPYPSVADFVYMLSQVFWSVGTLSLAGAIGAKYTLRSKKGKWLLVVVPLLCMAFSYYLLITVARNGSIELNTDAMKTFFDFYYPIGTAVSLAIVAAIYVLAHEYLGGFYKNTIYILFLGFLVQYFGDFLYTLSTNNETYFNGHWTDVLFTTSMFLLSFAITRLVPTPFIAKAKI